MKRTLLYLASVTALVMMLFDKSIAQNNDKLVNLGIKAGANYSWLNLEDVDDEKGLLGYHLGIFGKLNLTDYFGVQGELLYTTKGSELTYDNDFFDGKTSLKIEYIEIPVLAVIQLNENINLHGGPYFSFLVRAKAKNDSSVGLFDFEEEIDKDNFKQTDWGLLGGIGIDVSNIHGGVRYSMGLDKIEKEKSFNGVNYTFSDAMNSQVQLYIGVSF